MSKLAQLRAMREAKYSVTKPVTRVVVSVTKPVTRSVTAREEKLVVARRVLTNAERQAAFKARRRAGSGKTFEETVAADG